MKYLATTLGATAKQNQYESGPARTIFSSARNIITRIIMMPIILVVGVLMLIAAGASFIVRTPDIDL